MNLRNVVVAGLAATLLAGCGLTPGQKAEPVNVSGVVLLPSGTPVQNVTINFMPTSSNQVQGGAQIKADGKFTAMLTPGKYTIMIEGPNVKSVPAKYHANDANNTVEIPSSGTSDLSIKLTN